MAAPDLVVRPGTEADLPSVAAIYTHYTLRTTITFNTHVRTPVEWVERFRALVADGHHLLVAERDGQVVGYVETGRFRGHHGYAHTAEASIYVAPDQGGLGVGGALYERLFAVLAEAGRVHRLVAVVALPNDASCRFHERHGFVHRGTLTEVGQKFGHWLDTAYYERGV